MLQKNLPCLWVKLLGLHTDQTSRKLADTQQVSVVQWRAACYIRESGGWGGERIPRAADSVQPRCPLCALVCILLLFLSAVARAAPLTKTELSPAFGPLYGIVGVGPGLAAAAAVRLRVNGTHAWK